MAQDKHGLHRTLQSAVHSRDRAVTRVRRLTAATALTAAVAASGLGVLIASEPLAHSATVSGAAGSTTTTGKGSTGISAPSTTGSSGAAVTSPTTTTPATTISGQS
jgi:hypothetical protein